MNNLEILKQQCLEKKDMLDDGLRLHIENCTDELTLTRLLEWFKKSEKLNDKEIKTISDKQDAEFIKSNPVFMQKLNHENKIWLYEIKSKLENCDEPEKQDLILNEVGKIILNKRKVLA
jgi:hypothetical protein